ncbi:hypothetical protein [Bradyrhizobium sp. BR13661]|uniref:hypothetical protein n=1 Tax=Bradyrhizobium sp. BR13661 TaxID=2940622 RepID=UPI0024733C76|nr:hypothetical protein [Bradyrhizobium sp. BR13661]MDH6257616.1 hypothetical protein [Bradyrhizobium sp. BR13661]
MTSIKAAHDILADVLMMRAVCLGTVTAVLVSASSALAESGWLESKRLEASEIKALCERVSDIRLLARMQMISSGNARWRRLSRQELAIEATIMGVPPLNPSRCYAIARAGAADEQERRAFEVRDFIVSTNLTSVLLVGRAYDPPPSWVDPSP